jgi:hypothetical protein
MFGQGLGNLITLAELILVIPILIIIIMDPLGGLAGLFLFGLFCSRIVHHWRRDGK